MTLEEYIKEHAPMTYQAWLAYLNTIPCCAKGDDIDCNQGRNCPRREK